MPYWRLCVSPPIAQPALLQVELPMSRNIIVFSQMRPVSLTPSTSRVCRRRHSALWRSIQEISTPTNQLALENCCWGCRLYEASIRPLWNSFSLFVSWVKLQSRLCLGICCCPERQQAGLTSLAHRETTTSGDFGDSVELHAGFNKLSRTFFKRTLKPFLLVKFC